MGARRQSNSGASVAAAHARGFPGGIARRGHTVAHGGDAAV